ICFFPLGALHLKCLARTIEIKNKRNEAILIAHEHAVATRRIYDGKILNLRVDEVELENGHIALREVIEHGGAAAIVAFDHNGRLLMVRQYRYPMGISLLELPAGKLDSGESPMDCARRELEEETGYRCTQLISLGTIYPAAAYLTEVVHLFLAQDLVPSHQRLDDDEFLTVEALDFDEAVRMTLAGEIPDSKTQIGILKAKYLRDANQH
ncbi:MAG: NUDIX hydrolase, partial [Oscillospiraceae bacterium]